MEGRRFEGDLDFLGFRDLCSESAIGLLSFDQLGQAKSGLCQNYQVVPLLVSALHGVVCLTIRYPAFYCSQLQMRPPHSMRLAVAVLN